MTMQAEKRATEARDEGGGSTAPCRASEESGGGRPGGLSHVLEPRRSARGARGIGDRRRSEPTARHPQTAAARPSLFRGSRDGKACGCDGSVRRGHRVDAGQLPSGPTLGFSPRTPLAQAFLPVLLADTVPHADMPLCGLSGDSLLPFSR